MIHLDVFGRRARPEARVAPAAVDRLRSPIGRIAQGQFPSVRSKATSQPATRLQPHWDRICANVGDEPLPSFTEFFFSCGSMLARRRDAFVLLALARRQFDGDGSIGRPFSSAAICISDFRSSFVSPPNDSPPPPVSVDSSFLFVLLIFFVLAFHSDYFKCGVSVACFLFEMAID